MASQAAPRPPGPPHVPCELAQQANSGGFRLAQEFDAKTNLKGLSQEGTSTEQVGFPVARLYLKMAYSSQPAPHHSNPAVARPVHSPQPGRCCRLACWCPSRRADPQRSCE